MLSFRRALLWIVLSTLIVSGSVAGIVFGWRAYDAERSSNPRFTIRNIECDVLSANAIAQLLDLSTDRPTNLYAFDRREAEKRLMAEPAIAEVQIVRQKPDTLWVDCRLREPVALIWDETNRATDSEGACFSYSGGDLPHIVGEHHLDIALELLEELPYPVRLVDVSHVEDVSPGRREIVVVVEDRLEWEGLTEIYPRYLRLPVAYRPALANFAKLRLHLLKQEQNQIPVAAEGNVVEMDRVVIDLRIPHIATMMALND